MIIISCVTFFDLAIFPFQCTNISCQLWLFREISWQRRCHCCPFCAALFIMVMFKIKFRPLAPLVHILWAFIKFGYWGTILTTKFAKFRIMKDTRKEGTNGFGDPYLFSLKFQVMSHICMPHMSFTNSRAQQ